MNDGYFPLSSHQVPEETSPKSSERKRPPVKKLARLVVVVLLLAALAVTSFLYFQTRSQLAELSSPEGQQKLSERETRAVLDKLGKLTYLPDEKPVIATIVEADFLATQSAFYQKSQNGDKLVVFPQAAKAFIYSPGRNIIVNSGPVLNNKRSLSFEIRNGSSVAGAGEKIRTDLATQGAIINNVTNASYSTYQTTLIYAQNTTVPSQVLDGLATYLKGEVVTTLPQGETATQSDILVIIGQSSLAEAAASPLPSPVASPVPSPVTSPSP